jgi:hypothetical protein
VHVKKQEIVAEEGRLLSSASLRQVFYGDRYQIKKGQGRSPAPFDLGQLLSI